MACPGYPVSAALAFDALALPLLASFEQAAAPRRPVAAAQLAAGVRSKPGSRELLRVRLGTVAGRRVAVPLRRGASVLSSLAQADALLAVPAERDGLRAGAAVGAELLRDLDDAVLLAGAPDRALDRLALALAGSPRLAFCEMAPAEAVALVRARGCHAAAFAGPLDDPDGRLEAVRLAEVEVVLAGDVALRPGVRVAVGPAGTPAREVLDADGGAYEIVEARSDAAAFAAARRRRRRLRGGRARRGTRRGAGVRAARAYVARPRAPARRPGARPDCPSPAQDPEERPDEGDHQMRIAVLGAGAIGAYVGAALARGGADVHVVARGAHLEAMRRDGIRVRSARGDFAATPPATEDPRDIGPVDVVFLGLKANSYATAGPLLEPLLHDDTAVVAAQNGIPWWYFHGLDGPLAGHRVEAVDPGGAVTRVIAPERAIGCVVYAGTELEGPGIVRHLEGTRFTIGEPDGSLSERCLAFSEAMVAGGLKCPVETTGLRDEVWVKLMGNVAFNPLSALTRATIAGMCRYEPTRRLVATMMQETLEIAHAVGARPARLGREAPRGRREGRRAPHVDAAGPRGRQAARARRDHRRRRRARGADRRRGAGAALRRGRHRPARPHARPRGSQRQPPGSRGVAMTRSAHSDQKGKA